MNSVFRQQVRKLPLRIRLYYRHKYDAFTRIKTNINDSVVLTSTGNLNTRRSVGLETILNGNLVKNWSFDLTGNMFYTTIDARLLGFASNKTALSGNLKLNSSIRLFNGLTSQLNVFYYFPGITPQGQRNQFFYMNFGCRQKLFKNRAAITLTASDLLHSYKIMRMIDSNTLSQYTSISRKMPIIYIGFSWKFNNYKAKDELLYEGEGLRK